MDGICESQYYQSQNKNTVFVEKTMKRIKMYTESETRRVLGSGWSIKELYAFIANTYAHDAYEIRNLALSYLWKRIWGPAFFFTNK